MCTRTCNVSDALIDLPMAWLHRMATTLHAESAARLRTTCTLLQQVIDHNWEPVEVPVPPHMRSVPLSYAQIEAQLPPEEVYDPDRADSDDPDGDDEWERGYTEQNGCYVKYLETYGPALTRLTAHQAINTLKGKSVLGWLGEQACNVDKYSSKTKKMDDLDELLLLEDLKDGQGLPVVWPPKECPFDCDPESECECECQGRLEQRSQPGRGPGGWDDDDFGFYMKHVKPQEVLERHPDRRYSCHPHPWEVYVNNWMGGNNLLVKSGSSCQEATVAEMEKFSRSTSEDDVDMFDIYLSHGRDAGHIYVFLAPCEQRLTGQVKHGITLTPS